MKKKKPSWAYVIGILMILFGGCSLSNDIQSLNAPMMMEMQNSFLEGFNDGYEQTYKNYQDSSTIASDSTVTAADSSSFDPGQKIMKEATEFMQTPEATMQWIVRFGSIGIAVSLLYILAGLFLILAKRFSLPLFYTAMGISIAFAITKAIVLSTSGGGSFVGMSTGLVQIFSIVIDLILLIIVATANKDVYNGTYVSDSRSFDPKP